MERKVKIGIIGIGFMGSTHFHIHQANSKAEVVAIADVDKSKLEGDWNKIIGNIGGFDNENVDLSSIKTYEDGMDLIADPNVEMVDICVPTFLHKKYAIAALKAGKHVHLEKPIALNVEDAKEIIEVVKNSNSYFSVGLCVRFWPEYRHAWKLYKSGKIGKLISATFKRVSPNIAGNAWENWFMNSELSGGSLLDLHLHDADEIIYFFGNPKKVSAFGSKGFRSDKNGIDHSMTVYDFENGTLVTAEGGWDPAASTPFEMSFQIVCENATIRLSETGYKVIWEDGNIEEPKPAQDNLPTGWHVELDYFLDCIINNKKPINYITQKEIVDGIALIDAEQKAINNGKTIEVNYPS
jgi:predicted dehydrogenase